MPQPIWYTKAEDILLAHGRPAVTVALVVILAVTLYFLIRIWQGQSLVPAATWAVYMWLP
jgi:hypothetical protein